MAHHNELTQEWTVEQCMDLFRQPPGPWPEHWFGFPNICEAFRRLFDEACKNAPKGPDRWEHDRGIVICGGGWRFFASIYVTVRQIRAHGCDLPIQVWYLGDRGEFDIRMARALDPYGVGWMCANSWQRSRSIPRRILGGWEMKPFAALHAPFKEVICLDADSYPVYNPEVFMAHPEYMRVGASFWPDQQKLEHGQWERFGLPWHDEQAFESGQYIVDKSRHYKALWLTDWMNDYSDYVYKHIYGDKDTFHLAWRKAGHECCIPTTHPGWHHVAFLQKDFDGRTLFVHRTRDKFRWEGDIDGQPVNKWYMTGQYNHAVAYIADMPDEEQAHRFSDESSKLIRPELHFHFTDGPRGIDRKTWDEVALYNEYKLPDRFRRDDVVVDVGAHVGAFTWSCVRRGAGLVIAVEPMQENRERLVANLAKERNQVQVIPKGIWLENGSLVLQDQPCHEAGVATTYNLLQQSESGEGRVVETMTLEALIDHACSLSPSGRVRLLKLDCEGGEYPGLLWAPNLGRVDAICAEIHRNTPINGTVYSTGDIVTRLEEDGFIVETVQNGPNTDLLWASRPDE